eukprot:CAMPEP_0113463754 /NCGR_PEP_ID=MMETSP0014_2-20120614/12831_1 /TAXON_ID=2857 /ORGANISM="Nitzschia sp." /LENGTH=219 /DNA_ID=CAMNT_0000355779 /DNA_START=81 /DNA_END=740 /DNA_ORIENTATION=- /assembly_acc=CAM_ASM_000159
MPPQQLNVEFGKITQDNVEQLRMINTTCFPVSYQEKYYKDVVSPGQNNEGLSKLAYVGGFVVGATSSRIEDITVVADDKAGIKAGNNEENDDDDNNNNNKNADVGDVVGGDNNNNKDQKNQTQKRRIYIMTLGVLAAYRGRGIGTKLIQSILDYFEHNMMSDELKDVTEISLHVHVENQDAIDFYTEKFGFLRGELVENYYNKRSVDPPHSIRLYKPLR